MAMLLLLGLSCTAASAEPPATMREVRTTSLLGCKAPFTKCVETATVATPAPGAGEVLVQIEGSSVNPSDVDTVQLGGCGKGCGNDFAGTVVACPAAGCARLQVGDQVWGNGGPAFADFVAAAESHTSLRPASIGAAAAGTLPEVGLTSLFGLKRTVGKPSDPMPGGNPWAGRANLTVVITSGSGGTGSLAIEIAKAYGAANIWVAASGAAGAAFVRKLGATEVFDYKTQQGEILDALPDDSVDVVYDNYGGDGSPAKAMRVLRSGGSYLLIPHGACYVSKAQIYPCLALHPKAGVTQLNYDTGPDYAQYTVQGLDELKAMVDAGRITPTIDRTFALNESAAAFNYSAGPGGGGVGDHIGKISITTSTA